MERTEIEKIRDDVIRALSDFVVRVAKKGIVSESEIEVLPKVAGILLDFTQ